MKNQTTGVLLNFIFLITIWFICSGHFSVFFTTIGVISVLATIIVKTTIMGVAIAPQTKNYLPKIKYFCWLILEVFKSSIKMLILIWSRKPSANPLFIEIKCQISDSQIALMANSITLTPGTISAKLYNRNTLIVHALNAGYATGIEEIHQKIKTCCS